MKAITRGQALEISARVATQVNWDALDGDKTQKQIINLAPKEFSERFTAFLKNGARVISDVPKVIPIGRTSAFNLHTYTDEVWSIVEQDERSLKLTEVDLTKVILETMLKDCESSVIGEEKLKRLKDTGHIRLDAKILQTLLENRCLILESWKERSSGDIVYISFDGTIFQDSEGHRFVLCLYWFAHEWNLRKSLLSESWFDRTQSAVLAG